MNSSSSPRGVVLGRSSTQNLPSHGNTQYHKEVPIMKRFGIWLIITMFGLVLVCGCGEDKKAPAKPADPPATVEKVAPPAPPATPPPATPDHPKSEHPK